MNGYFYIEKSTVATGDARLDNAAVKNLWNSFCLGEGVLTVQSGDDFTFRIGKTELPTLSDGIEYALKVDGDGVAIAGNGYGGLMRGLFALLLKAEQDESSVKIKHVFEKSNYIIKNRMIHVCVFPENDLYFIKKLIRLAALCQYTHIVIEFWGMLRYDCLKELAWPQAFSKSEAAELIKECRDLGIEPIPMFNMFGHASACRVKYGKHVVLDQNPKLQYLFTPDGWVWDINSDKVRALHKKIRRELYELFGEGEFFHVGLDEAYYYSHSADDRKTLPDYIRFLTDEVAAEGRRPMVWMDMFLEKDKFNGKYKAYATCPPDEVEVMQSALNPATVMVDWQYKMLDAPVETLVSLNGSGHDVMGAPWYNPENYQAIINTVSQHGMFGIMMTTWHTLSEYMGSILGCALKFGAASFVWDKNSDLNTKTAVLLRRVSFEGNNYHSSGFSKNQIEI